MVDGNHCNAPSNLVDIPNQNHSNETNRAQCGAGKGVHVANPVGIGIIGTGTIAQSHLRSLQGFEKAHVVGVYDVLEDRAKATAAQHGIPRVATSLEDLLTL